MSVIPNPIYPFSQKTLQHLCMFTARSRPDHSHVATVRQVIVNVVTVVFAVMFALDIFIALARGMGRHPASHETIVSTLVEVVLSVWTVLVRAVTMAVIETSRLA